MNTPASPSADSPLSYRQSGVDYELIDPLKVAAQRAAADTASHLQAHGFSCDVAPFFDERYTAAVLGGGEKLWWRFGQAAVRRLSALLHARRYDLVVVHSEFIPLLPHAFEHWLGRLAVPGPGRGGTARRRPAGTCA